MVLVIDNYDSFTYNLVQILRSRTAQVIVRRNDAMTVAEVQSLQPRAILISPGPGRPETAGISMAVIREFAGQVPILGVCLGLQAIGATYGGQVVHAPSIMHGMVSEISHDGKSIFSGVSNPFVATRYHSLVVSRDGLPHDLEITAWTDGDVIMGLRHRRLSVEGVQFHPESILTSEGEKIVHNWMLMHL